MKLKEKPNLPLKTVHPRSVRHHGLFGLAFVKQHMVIDECWSPDSLTAEFEKMTLFLKKYSQFNRLEKKLREKSTIKTCRALQKLVRDGRSNLKVLRAGCQQEVRNILSDNRPMQRLYQQMPLHSVVENINQKTFGLRKERDRLGCRLQQLEKVYEEKLKECADLENRISYENEFKLHEEIKIADVMKKLQNSKVRLQATMSINSTYKKLIQILQHDATFYAPIMRSLNDDIEDQSLFIKHILHLGSPALERFRELRDQYKSLQDKARRTSRANMAEYGQYQNMTTAPQKRITKMSSQHDIPVKVRRYVRETRSMRDLKAKFEEIEETIRQIKIATLCSDEKDIYKRIKSQVNNNYNLDVKIENDSFNHNMLDTKMKYAEVLQGVLINNLTENETTRLEQIQSLKDAIKMQDDLQESTLAEIKSHANVFVLIRMSLWNLHEILKHVGPRQIVRPQYPVDYLKLPLLTYEMLTIKAFPPDAFEQNIMTLLRQVLSKLQKLTTAFSWKLSESSINLNKKLYCEQMIQDDTDMDVISMNGEELKDRRDQYSDTSIMNGVQSLRNVPDRNDIKIASARFVEDILKKDD